MRDLLAITEFTFTPASRSLRATGLLGFLRLVLNDTVVIDGITIRRTLQGAIVVSWPEPHTRGSSRRVVRPRDEDARAFLEREILKVLRRRGEVS